jgi:hypothetical protein
MDTCYGIFGERVRSLDFADYDHILVLIEQYGYLSVFLVVMMESAAGVPVPRASRSPVRPSHSHRYLGPKTAALG